MLALTIEGYNCFRNTRIAWLENEYLSVEQYAIERAF